MLKETGQCFQKKKFSLSLEINKLVHMYFACVCEQGVLQVSQKGATNPLSELVYKLIRIKILSMR